MKKIILLSLLLASLSATSQNVRPLSPLDGRAWGVVLEHPETENVIVKQDVVYLNDSKGTLKMDVYLPPHMGKEERRPAIIFLNAIGDQPGQMKLKSWATYTSWPRLVAANGYVGISMECDGTRIQESLKQIFLFIASSGPGFNIDVDKLGVYAASANVSQSIVYLMSVDAYKGIKAAALYYGASPQGPFRKDLPVYYVVAEGDRSRTDYSGLWSEVMKNNAPWTIAMGSNLIHGFDSFEDDDNSRQVIKETISFWKNHLDPIPSLANSKNIGREIVAASYRHDDPMLIELLERWLIDHPDDSDALFQYASALKNVKRYDASLAAYQKVLKLEPDNVRALTYVYLILQTQNRPTEAEPYLQQAEKTGKMDKYMYTGMGYTMYSLNKYKEGVQFFERVTQLDPAGLNFYNLACGYARLAEKEKAYTALDKAIGAGFGSRQQFEKDSDLDSLRNDERFKNLLSSLK